MSTLIRVLLISVMWVVIEIGSGYLTHLMPQRWFRAGGALSRILFRTRGWERGGAFYDRAFAVRRWKDRLPEAGDWFAGGMRKRLGPGTDTAFLVRLATETRRAELTHWLPVALSATFFLWNPPYVAVWMPIIGFIGNAPFIIVQRYNRPRIERAIARG
jgi:glycosyl-4,4'-diaponeurosporenoate acyltransferase